MLAKELYKLHNANRKLQAQIAQLENDLEMAQELLHLMYGVDVLISEQDS